MSHFFDKYFKTGVFKFRFLILILGLVLFLKNVITMKSIAPFSKDQFVKE